MSEWITGHFCPCWRCDGVGTAWLPSDKDDASTCPTCYGVGEHAFFETSKGDRESTSVSEVVDAYIEGEIVEFHDHSASKAALRGLMRAVAPTALRDAFVVGVKRYTLAMGDDLPPMSDRDKATIWMWAKEAFPDQSPDVGKEE